MSATWFLSDLHIGHRLVSEIRGFDTTEEHDAVLAANWDSVVRDDDIVWFLGDLAMGGRGKGPELRGLQWVSERPGIKHCIAGNHDGCSPIHRESHKIQRLYLEKAFSSVQSAAIIKIKGHRVRMSHFPYLGENADHTETPRYPEWRFPDDGTLLIHGHTHSDRKVFGPQIHVGLDAHELKPVSLHWIEKVIEEMDNAV